MKFISVSLLVIVAFHQISFADVKYVYDCPYGISSQNSIGELKIDVRENQVQHAVVADGLHAECKGRLDQQFKNGVVITCGFWQGKDPVTDRTKTLVEVQHREPIGTGTLSLSVPFNDKRYYIGCDGFDYEEK